MSFQQVVQPAIALAREGFPVHHIMMHNMDLSLVERIGFAVLMAYNTKVYLGGQWWRPMYPKDRLKLPDLANTLEAMAKAEQSAVSARGEPDAGSAGRARLFLQGPDRGCHREDGEGAARAHER